MHSYTICGFTVNSELCFPELKPIETSPDKSSPDIVIRIRNFEKLDLPSTNTTSSFTLKSMIGKIFLSKGCEIMIEPAEDIEDSISRNLILGSVLACLLRQRGLLVFHGSAVKINKVAVAFLGHSGWGKSTLASAFHKQGYGMITDDVMAVNMATGLPIALPSFPKTKLCEDAAIAMEHDVEQLSKVHSSSHKYVKCISEGFAETPLPLKRIYILAVGEEHKIEPINGRNALMELLKHSHGTNLLELSELATSNFNQCQKLLEHISIYRLVRPRSLSQLTESIRLVEENINAQPTLQR